MTDLTDRLIQNAMRGNVQQAPIPQQVQMPMIAFAEQLAALVDKGIITKQQAFNWLVTGKEPTEFVNNTSDYR